MLEKILVSEKELSDINFKRLKKAYIKNNLIDSDNKMYLTVDSLTDINNIINGLNNFTIKYSMLDHMDVITCIWIKI